MKITSLSVEGAGRFGSRVRVEGLSDGVNILAAGNEAGKSTLFKCVRACLFERHGTTNRAVAELCTEGLSLPLSVELGFEHDGHDYLVAKTFVRSPSAVLRKDGVEIARGRQADEAVWEVLGMEPGSGRSVDEAAFGLLWVSQGAAVEQPTLSGAAANTLNGIVHAEVGSLVGGERARLVVETIAAELDKQLTQGGRPKTNGPLGRVNAQAASLTAEFTEMRERLRNADHYVGELERLNSERSTLADPTVLDQMRRDLESAETQLRQSTEAQNVLARAELAEAQAAAALKSAAQEMDALTDCAVRIDTARKREADLVQQLSDSEEMAQQAQSRHDAAQGDLDELNKQIGEIGARERALRQVEEALTADSRRADLEGRIQVLRELAGKRDPIEGELRSIKVTAQDCKVLDDLERELSTLDARLEAGAARVEVEILPAGDGKVTLDDEVILEGAALPLLAPATITVGDLARIKASPPAAFGRQELARRQSLEEQQNNLLAKAAVVSVALLRQADARRSELETQRDGVLAQLRALGIQPDEAANAIAKAATDVAALDAMITQAMKASNLDVLPTASIVAEQLRVLTSDHDALRAKAQMHTGLLDAQRKILTDAGAAGGSLKGQLGELRRTLGGDVARLPEGEREGLLESTKAAFDQGTRDHQCRLALLLEQRSRSPSDEEVERLRNRIARLRAGIETQQSKVGNLNIEIAKLEALITSVGAEGLGEKVAGLEQELELCAREGERLQARVSMLQLLRGTVERCYHEQRERLNAPLIRHLQPFLNDLFPDAAPTFGDDFALTGLGRDGAGPETFERLSDGTQEQVAVLVRLAMGSLICEAGGPVPVILDDALVFSDDDRIERMFDALTRAGRRQQVIIFTCRMRAFASLGGKQLAIARG